jgi:hypothetical protein
MPWNAIFKAKANQGAEDDHVHVHVHVHANAKKRRTVRLLWFAVIWVSCLPIRRELTCFSAATVHQSSGRLQASNCTLLLANCQEYCRNAICVKRHCHTFGTASMLSPTWPGCALRLSHALITHCSFPLAQHSSQSFISS